MNKCIKIAIIVFGIEFSIARIATASDKTNGVLFIVDGMTNSYSEVQITDTNAFLQYKLLYGHKPSKTEDFQQFKNELEKERFIEKIRHVIFEQKKIAFNITVTDVEVNDKWRQLTNGVDFEAAVQRQRETIGPLLTALKAVYEKGENEDAVFTQMLKGRMAKSEWEVDLNYYATPQRREILERTMLQTAQELRKPDLGIRSMLVTAHLEATHRARLHRL